MSKKIALLTGVTGQDGSFMAEILLKKGYEVHGLIRRASTPNDGRIAHISDKLQLHYSDLSDGASLVDLVSEIVPDEIYSLAAQSHVRVSFDVPEYTCDITGMGVLRLLEAIRKSGISTRMYQAGSSEQFGSSKPPQNEDTLFKPESPYACAKIFAYNMVKLYRKAYGIFASNGICFNHECISSNMPMIYKMDNNFIDIKPISEICEYVGVNIDKDKNMYQSGEPNRNVQIWDKNEWTTITFASAFPHKIADYGKKPKIINARNSVIMATSNHVFFKDDDTEISCGELSIGDKVANIDMPISSHELQLDNKLCFLIGAIVGDGYIHDKGNIQYTSKNIDEIDLIDEIWLSLSDKNSSRRCLSTSGFTGEKNIWQLYLTGECDIIRQFNLYNDDDTKRVPYEILNSTKENMLEFLKGYNMADGMKANPCIYLFKNFKTNSATLAQGLIYLISQTTKQKVNITVEESDKWGYKTHYYSINLLSNSKYSKNTDEYDNKIQYVRSLLEDGESQRNVARITGVSRETIRKIQHNEIKHTHPLQKDSNEIKKIIDYDDYDGWFYDLETSSGTFHCGIGYGHVHNSERRGDNFVTKKITKAAARIKHGLQDTLYLGNIDSYRDWGYAQDYCGAMHLMLQHDEPDDFVIATGESHSVREFLELSFDKVGLDPYKYVKFDENLKRASEVDHLRGDYTKINKVLGWKPETTFKGLVDIMVDYDMHIASMEASLK